MPALRRGGRGGLCDLRSYTENAQDIKDQWFTDWFFSGQE
jgi:hypothetical protein